MDTTNQDYQTADSDSLDSAEQTNAPSPFASASSSEPSINSFASLPPEPPKKTKSPLFLIILICSLLVLIVVVFVALRFSRFWPTQSGSNPAGDEPIVKSVYTTPVDSTDPEGDYIAYLEQNIKDASTSAEKLSAILRLAEYFRMNSQFERCLAVLDTIDPNTLSAEREYYVYYSAYAELYSEEYANNPDLYAKYSALVAEHAS